MILVGINLGMGREGGGDINRVASRVLGELMKPMRDVRMDDQEFAFMKAIVLFDPGRCNLGIGE